jgi:hypothetical protein
VAAGNRNDPGPGNLVNVKTLFFICEGSVIKPALPFFVDPDYRSEVLDSVKLGGSTFFS